MDKNALMINCFRSPVPFILILFMFHEACEGYYMKPYDAKSSGVQIIIPPKPQPQPPRQPEPVPSYTNKPEVPKDVKKGGQASGSGVGWGISFNIWIWVEVQPVTEAMFAWNFQTTTVPSVIIISWYTTVASMDWGVQIHAFDDVADETEKKTSGVQYTCFSWNRECLERKAREKAAGRMRSIGGGTDGADNAIIAFIVIVVVAAIGIGGVFYWRKRHATLAELEEPDEEAKEEPDPGAEEDETKEGEEAV